MSDWKPCKKCGSTKDADTQCSHCGGHGMVTGAGGDPTECWHCGYSGIQHPPICPDCCAYRAEMGAL
jgi:ribosomal protein L32